MILIRLFCFATLLVTTAAAQRTALNPIVPAAYNGPARTNLSGVWDFRLDPDRVGETERWFSAANPTSQGWTRLAVPGSFNEQLSLDSAKPKASDVMRFLKTDAWYRTTFASPKTEKRERGGRCYLHLSGAVLRYTVWLNGEMVGRGSRPYLEETFDVSEQLKNGSGNLLVIRVDNTIPERGIPDKNWHGWWDDGGLIRPVYLEVRPPVSSDSRIVTRMSTADSWTLKIVTSLHRSDKPKKATVSYHLEDSTHHVLWRATKQVPSNSEGEQKVDLSAVVNHAVSWSPENPTLYTLTILTKSGGLSDTVRLNVGFRQIESRGTQILLNGRPYPIHGVSRHQFLAGAGMSLTVAQNRKDIEDIKALGANFVRLAHYSQSQDVYDACDQLGLLVWTEIPAWQSSVESLSDPEVWANDAEPQLRGMVHEYRNHPSVVIWSVANEIPSDVPAGAAYVAKAIAYVKSLDDSRLVTFASDRRISDVSFGPVDLIAINEYFGWYYGQQTDVGPMLDEMHRLFPNKPILVSEFGADAIADWNPKDAPQGGRDYSYTNQENFLETHMNQIFAPERQSFMAGALVWVYNDFPAPDRIGGDHPPSANYRNNKGIVTMDRTHKPVYGMVQSFFRREQQRQEQSILPK